MTPVRHWRMQTNLISHLQSLTRICGTWHWIIKQLAFDMRKRVKTVWHAFLSNGACYYPNRTLMWFYGVYVGCCLVQPCFHHRLGFSQKGQRLTFHFLGVFIFSSNRLRLPLGSSLVSRHVGNTWGLNTKNTRGHSSYIWNWLKTFSCRLKKKKKYK